MEHLLELKGGGLNGWLSVTLLAAAFQSRYPAIPEGKLFTEN